MFRKIDVNKEVTLPSLRARQVEIDGKPKLILERKVNGDWFELLNVEDTFHGSVDFKKQINNEVKVFWKDFLSREMKPGEITGYVG